MLSANQLYEGDCLDLLPRIDAESIDMILCDLPYGTTQNKWDSLIPLDELWLQYTRIIKPNGVIALTSQGLFTARLMLSKQDWFRYKFVWVKSKPTNFLNARRQPLRQHEDICIFYKQQPVYRPVMSYGGAYDKGVRKNQYTGSYGDFKPVRVKSEGERFPTDSLYCKTAESELGGRVWHPTQKPVALGRYLIRLFTAPGQIVLDNAFGSGSFLVSAVLERRKYIGIEKNQELHQFKSMPIDYIEVAQSRIDDARKLDEASRPPMHVESISRAMKLQRRGLVDVDQVIGSLFAETAQ